MIRTKISVPNKSFWAIGYLIPYNKAITFTPYDSLDELMEASESLKIIPDYYYIFRCTSDGDVYVRYQRISDQWFIIKPSIPWIPKEPNNILKQVR